MTAHNRILFHCLCCGTVYHAELNEAAPICCGKRMVNAAAETVFEAGDDNQLMVVEQGEREPRRPVVQPLAR
jgi:hypothetical protein